MKFTKNFDTKYPIKIRKSKVLLWLYLPLSLMFIFILLILVIAIANNGLIHFLSFISSSYSNLLIFLCILFTIYISLYFILYILDIFWFRIILNKNYISYRSIFPKFTSKRNLLISQQLLFLFLIKPSYLKGKSYSYQDIYCLELRRDLLNRGFYFTIHIFFKDDKKAGYIICENELKYKEIEIIISTIIQKNKTVILKNIKLI